MMLLAAKLPVNLRRLILQADFLYIMFRVFACMAGVSPENLT